MMLVTTPGNVGHKTRIAGEQDRERAAERDLPADGRGSPPGYALAACRLDFRSLVFCAAWYLAARLSCWRSYGGDRSSTACSRCCATGIAMGLS